MMNPIHRNLIIGFMGLLLISLETVAQTPEVTATEKPVATEKPAVIEDAKPTEAPVKVAPKRLIKKPSEHRISR